jgi:hypothetical protein
LLGQPDLAHAAFSDFLQEAIAADHRPGSFTGVHGLRGPKAAFARAGGNIGVELFFRKHVSGTPGLQPKLG